MRVKLFIWEFIYLHVTIGKLGRQRDIEITLTLQLTNQYAKKIINQRKLKNRFNMKKPLLILIIFIFSIVLSGCNLSSTEILPTPTIVPTSTPAPTIPPTETPLPVGIETTIIQIEMMSENGIGWAKNDEEQILFTEDGGSSWRNVSPPEEDIVDNKLAHPFFLNAEIAWVTYSNQDFFEVPENPSIWMTNDSGVSWIEIGTIPVDIASFAIYIPLHFFFADSINGWLMVHVESGMSHTYVYVYRTINGGENWEEIINPFTDQMLQGCQKTDLMFISPSDGWITLNCEVMPGAHVVNTIDGGLTWSFTTLAAPAEFPDIFSDDSFCKTNNLLNLPAPQFSVSCTLFSNGGGITDPIFLRYQHTENGYQFLDQPPSADIQFSDPKIFSFGGDIFQYREETVAWEFIGFVNWDGQFSFPSPTDGWAVATNPDTGEITLMATTDGGLIWEKIHPIVVP